MSELKPCPSCNHGAAFYGVDSYYVECCNCGLRTKRFRTGKEAIAARNRRAEPANEPLTLDELWGMGGQPVWIVEYPDCGHWELSADAADYLCDRDPDFYGMKHDDPAGRYGLHALGWLAYRRKPEPEGRENDGPTI